MDINDLRTISTLLAFIAFASVVAWAYSSQRKHSFDEAANLPFTDEEAAVDGAGAGHKHN